MTIHPFPRQSAPLTVEKTCPRCGVTSQHSDSGGIHGVRSNFRAATCKACGYTGGANFGLPGQRYGKHGGAF